MLKKLSVTDKQAKKIKFLNVVTSSLAKISSYRFISKNALVIVSGERHIQSITFFFK